MFLDDSMRDALSFYKQQISIQMSVNGNDRLFIHIIFKIIFKFILVPFATHLENQFNGIRPSDDL